MYIHPFWVGFASCILIEVAAILILATVFSRNLPRPNNHDTKDKEDKNK